MSVSGLRIATMAVAAGMVAASIGCGGNSGPRTVAREFVSAFAARDIDGAAKQTDNPEKAEKALAGVWEQLQAEGMSAEVGAEQFSGDTATVDFTYRWRLPRGRVWSYRGQVQLGRQDGAWGVRWSAADIHPNLGDNQTMALRTSAPEKARVAERSGSEVLVPGVLHAVLFDASAAGERRIATANQLVTLLSRFDRTLKSQELVESATAANGPYRVLVLRTEDFDQVSAQLAPLPGVSFMDQSDLLPADRAFAPELLAEVRKTVIDEVDGAAGWSVVTVNPNGVDTDVLTETPPRPAPSVTISVDRRIQDAAQQALDRRREQAMMVILRPSTGAMLAVAQNPAADRGGPLATTGLFPPGSTFKIVTAAAAISAGLAGPTTPVPCPSRIVIGQRTIPNYADFSLGSVPLATAFARSCNTTFAKLAGDLRPESLHVAAAQLGIGPDYTLVGIPTVSGSVPGAPELVVRTEDGFGQGKILVTPFGMALAAAAVARGSVPPRPFLIDGRRTEVEGKRPPLTPAQVDGLRQMMRQVVTAGTAARIADQGEVYGKTGEAEYPGGSHAWFVGYRGDLAFATLIVGGGSSDNAVDVTREMFRRLPPEV